MADNALITRTASRASSMFQRCSPLLDASATIGRDEAENVGTTSGTMHGVGGSSRG
jgi:hypothetical protein